MALNTEIDLERKQPLQGKEGWRLQFTVDTYRAIIEDLKAATGVTSIITSGGIDGGGTGDVPVFLSNTGAVPGSYTTADITVDEKGRITAVSSGSGGAGSAGTANEHQVTDNAGGFVASIMQESAGVINVGGTADPNVIFSINSATLGFSMPRHADPSVSLPAAAPGIMAYSNTSSAPEYIHPTDGWVPVGRYALNGAVINSGSAPISNRMLVSSASDGEMDFAPFRWGFSGANAQLYGLNSSGALLQADLGGSSTSSRWRDIYIVGKIRHSWYDIAGNNGSDAGMSFYANQGSGSNAQMKLVSTNTQEGIFYRDDGFAIYSLDTSACMELVSTTRGFLPPKMTTAQMAAISTPAEGLIVHASDADRPHYNDGTSWKGFGDLYGLYAQTVALTPITTAGEQTLIQTGGGVGSLSIPANAFAVGDSFHAKIGGKLNATGGGGRTEIIIRIKTGTTVLASTGVFDLDTATDQGWELELDFTIATIGATGSICTNGNFVYTKDGSRQVYGYLFQDVQTIDTTASNTLDITHEYNVLNGGDDIYSANFVLHRNYKA